MVSTPDGVEDVAPGRKVLLREIGRAHDWRPLLALLVIAGLSTFLSDRPVWAQTEPGLIAAWGFDEGSGTVAADRSGNGNAGAVVGATWTTQGRFGSALVFDGTTSRVRGPSLALGPAFTLMAWVLNPTRIAYETLITVGGTRDLYLGNGVPAFYTGSAELAFGSAIANGVWHHVALVSDGATLVAYLNGAPWGKTRAVALGAVSGPLQVGAWILGADNADYFAGTLDEVRVYDHALAPDEIQTVMNLPLGGPPADTTPPLRSGGQPTGTLPAGTTDTTLALTTNETATCRYSPSAGVRYDSMTQDFATTGGTAHATPVSGLSDGGSYAFYVRCRDAVANANPDDFAIVFGVASTSRSGHALRFYGNGSNDIDRVKIPIDDPELPADVGATDFTLEFWMKAFAPENPTPSCVTGNDNWISGNIMFDRDIVGGGDFGDFGISLAGGRIAFGVNNGTTGAGICSAQIVADGIWHHVAATRSRATGHIRIFVDGLLDAEDVGPLGDLSYRDNRASSFVNEPYLVIGAEKHDAGPAYPSYSGWIDEVRLSDILRYAGSFPLPSAPFSPDPNTVALYHFDEGDGDFIADSSGAPGGPSDGVRRFGGTPAGPQWVTDTPFHMPGPDTTPPVRSSGQPSGTLAACTSGTTLALTTDEAATCRYSASAGVPYDSMTQAFATTGGTSHTTPVAGLSNGGSYVFTVRCRDAAGNANPDDFAIAFDVASTSVPGLIVAWGFDEGGGSTAGDGSGNGNSGSVIGAAWTTQGRFGSALVFDGTNSRVTGPSITLGPAFTLMAWVLHPTRTAYEAMMTVGASRDFYLASGRPSFYAASTDVSFGGAIADGLWHHVALVWDGAELRAYVNGSPWGTPSTAALGTISGPLQVGAWIWGAGNADYFAGTIDEVRVYDRALMPDEIQTVMNAPGRDARSGPTLGK